MNGGGMSLISSFNGSEIGLKKIRFEGLIGNEMSLI